MSAETKRVGDLQPGQRFRFLGDVFVYEGQPGRDCVSGCDSLLTARRTDWRRYVVTLFSPSTEVEVLP